MAESLLPMNKKECQQWMKTVGSTEKYKELLKTMRMRVMAPYLFGEDFLPTKWRKWLDEYKFQTYKEKWLEVEPIDVDEYDKVDLMSELLNKLSTQIKTNGVDFQRFMNLAVKMDKQSDLDAAISLAEEEVSFERLWERCSQSTEESRIALMAIVFSYIQFALDTVQKKDLHKEMTSLDPKEKEEVESFKNKGNEDYRQERYSKAVLQYNKAIRTSRYCPKLYNNRCMAFLNMKKYNHALMDAKRAVTLDPTWSKAQYRYAQAMFELGYHRRAIKSNLTALEQCRRENPSDPNIKELETQKEIFEIRQQEKITLDDIPDLVDPSSSDWEDDDLDSDEKSKMKETLENRVKEEKDNLRRHNLHALDDKDGLIKIPKSLAGTKSASKERREREERRKQKEEEKKKQKDQEKRREEEARQRQRDQEEREEERRREKEARQNQERERKRKEFEQKKQREEQMKVVSEVSELEKQLQHGSEAMLEQRGRQALMFYKTAMDLISKSPKQYGGLCEEDYVIFLYAYGMACLESGIDQEILEASNKFEMILENHSRIRTPLPYYGLSYALFKQNKFNDVFDPLKKAMYVTEKFKCRVETWPGTKHKISVTEEGQMKITLERLEATCKQPPPPDAICRLDSCPFKPEMYLTDVGFKGYAKVVCKEKCYMDYHLVCWKRIKAEEYPDVTSEKELLGMKCRTPDCDGVYISVTICGPDGLPKTEHQLDEAVKTKEKKNKGFSKQQAKKNRKVHKVETSKKRQQEKGQGDGEETAAAAAADGKEQDSMKRKDKKAGESQSVIGNLPNLTSQFPVPMDAASVASSNTADGDDEEDDDDDEDDEVQLEAAYVLKKDDLEEEPATKAVKSRPRKKKGKEATSMPIEVTFADTAQRQMWHGGDIDEDEPKVGLRTFPGLDQDNPFATPEHLQDEAREFERRFNLTDVSEPATVGGRTEEEKSQIAALHMHFEEVLQRLGPMTITDSRLGDELQQMPHELQAIVDRSGGLDKFLLESHTFKMIEDHICLHKDSAQCQEMVKESKALRAGNFVDPPLPKTRSSKGKQASDRNNSRANLAPEHFPNINEALAGDAIEQKRKKQQAAAAAAKTATADAPPPPSASKMDTLEEIYMDSDEKRAARMQAAIKEVGDRGLYKDAKNLDYSDRAKVFRAFRANPGMEQMVKLLEQQKYHEECERALLQHTKEEESKEEEERKKRAELGTKKESRGIKTFILTNKGLLSDFLPINKPHNIREKLEKKGISIPPPKDEPKASTRLKTRPSQSTTDKSPGNASVSSAANSSLHNLFSTLSANAEPFIPSAASANETKMKSELADTKNENKAVNHTTETEFQKDETQPSADLQLPVSSRGIPENEESGFYSTSSSGESLVNSLKTEQSSDAGDAQSVSEASVKHEDQEPVISREDNSDEDSDEGSFKEAQEEPHLEPNSSPDEGTSDDQTPREASKPVVPEETSCELNDTDTSPHVIDATSDTTSNPTADTKDTGDSEAAAPQQPAKQESASNGTVSLEKYNELLQKYKMVFSACKTYIEEKKLLEQKKSMMKCTWTQCPKPTVKTRAIGTGPDKVLEEVRANEYRLRMTLKDLNEKYSGLRDQYDTEVSRLKTEVAELRRVNSKLEAEGTKLSKQLLESKKTQEGEKSRLHEELHAKKKQISKMEGEIASLTRQMTTKDDLFESNLKTMQSERDFWTAEKVKLEEALASLERTKQSLLRRCQDAELSVLQLRCAKDVAPLEATIKESEFHINSCRNVFQRNPNVNESFKEFGIAWEKCFKENKALLAAHEAKYHDLAQQIKAGRALNELEPPKQVRPAKVKAPSHMPPPLQPRGTPGLGMPFGPHMGAPGTNPSGPAQHMPQPHQMPPKLGAGVGLGNQQQAELSHSAGGLQEIEVVTPADREPTPPQVPASVGAAPATSGFPGGQAQSREGPMPLRSGNQSQGWTRANLTKQPVSLAQMQSNQQPPVMATGMVQGHGTVLSGPFQQPQHQAQALRQPSTVVTASINGAQQTPSLTTQNASLAQPPTPAVPQGATTDAASAASYQQTPQPRTNFEKIIFPLQNMFPEYNKVQLTKVIKDVRAANKGSLSGLSIEDIIHRATELILNQQRATGQRGQSAAGRPGMAPAQQQQGAAGMKRPPPTDSPSFMEQWEPAKPQAVSAWGVTTSENKDWEEEEEDPCVICHEEMLTDTVTLHCGHRFHPDCIKMWLQEQRTCPTCRNYTLLPDEYPSPK